MDMKYVAYTFADPYFYDDASGATRTGTSVPAGYQLSRDVDWSSWTRFTRGGWAQAAPAGAELPAQGWKIHSSATPDNAQHLLTEISRYCGERSIAFKHRPSRDGLLRTNLKYADRGGSGKFVTIYPDDDEACLKIIEDLHALVGGEPGPYILSDLRWKTGPLYLRYGGFRMELLRDKNDELVPAVRRPDGELEPDVRAPRFSPPAWAPMPDFVTEAKADLAENQQDPFPYAISRALHFSNAGGVYLAEPVGGGAQVVLKEARPHAGLSPDGRDAVDRLRRENDMLTRLADVPAVVDAHDVFESFGHHFLVEEHVAGQTLTREMTVRNPIVRVGCTGEDRIAYRDWALGILAKVDAALDAMHAREIVFADLHPNNVMVDEDGEVRFIDLEMAHDVDDPPPVTLGAPGFLDPDGRRGIAADRYALGCLKLSLFLPLTMLFALDRAKAGDLVAEAARLFELPDEVGSSILGLLALTPRATAAPVHVRRARSLVERWPIDTAEGLGAVRAGIARGIWENADLSRPDRVFPGDIRQFAESAAGIAHGAAGNLLADPGAPGDTERVLDWIEDAVERSPALAPGYLDGLTGIAATLRRFGRDDAADRLFAKVAALPLDRLPSELYGGLAGIGLGLLHEHARGQDPAVLAAVHRIRDVLRAREPEMGRHISTAGGQRVVATGKGGLMSGATGQALFWLGSFEAFGDKADLGLARAALATDLAACVRTEDGSLHVNEGWRTMPYLASGSAGIGLVVLRALRHLDDPELRSALDGIAVMTRATFSIQPNLVNGRAGIVVFLAALAGSAFSGERTRADLVRHTRALALHAMTHRTGIHFPGEQLLRLSADWATGSAGVLTALDAYGAVIFGSPHRAGVVPGLFPERS